MTEKDYRLIAWGLYDVRRLNDGTWNTAKAVALYDRLAKSIARELSEDNPRFNSDLFLHDAAVTGY